MSSQQKIDGATIFVDSTIQILPVAFHLNIGFVHAPTFANGTFVHFPENHFELWREFLNPTVDVGMIYRNATLSHHLLDVSTANNIR